MKQLIHKIFTRDVLVFFAIALPLFGILGYSEFRLNKVTREVEQANIKIAEADKYIKDLNDAFRGTTSNITDVLAQEQQKNSFLDSQFKEITNTVGALEKLSTTDPELLKKYSKVYFLNEHYVPISLSAIDSQYRNPKSTNYQFHSDALPFLEKLIDAANDEDGLTLQAQSAYRSFATQSSLKASYKVTYGAGTANQFSAEQGYSEHQLGTALDFTTGKTNGVLEGFDKTPEYTWLLNNAYKYGFVISYPAGNTYYKFEPWHWRFVGVALATKLHDDSTYFYGVDQRIIDSYLANLFD